MKKKVSKKKIAVKKTAKKKAAIKKTAAKKASTKKKTTSKKSAAKKKSSAKKTSVKKKATTKKVAAKKAAAKKASAKKVPAKKSSAKKAAAKKTARKEIQEEPEMSEEEENTEETALALKEGDDGEHHEKAIGIAEMYSDWFLDYASYVILERAVPHLDDGFKPVQRRIMHSMREKEDGRYNKVANLVGHTMQYHPHGDASIGDALVQLGQKNYLIDTQGNWGNPLTGDSAAAPRYIEARLSKFALDVVFSPKITQWAASYDTRNKEPVTLPVKFPLLLVQGVEGIAVGLSCKILPHNFIEVIDASIAALRKQPFELYPDFYSAGIADCSDYNEGLRGGRVKVRARINKGKRKSELVITELPFGTTTLSLIDSIVSANDKGKIKISRVLDNTAAEVEIVVYLPAGADQDQTIQALYAFTDCEVSIAPNSCVIHEDKPKFLSVHQLLKLSAQRTRDLLGQELEIKLHELEEKWHFSSLEKIFIEKRIYRDIEECTTWEAVIEAIWKGLKPYLKLFLRKVTEEDIVRLTEIKIKRISKFDSFKADEIIRGLEKDIEEVKKNIKNLTRFTIRYYEDLKKKYGAGRERKTELTTFSKVIASEVAVATETLYVNRSDGFAGWGLKRDGEAVEKCSRMDDVIAFASDGTFRVTKISDKAFIGKRPVHVAIFRKEETAIYSLVYRDGKAGRTFVKRFEIQGVTRDKVYDLTKGTKGTRVLYFVKHDNEEESSANNVVVHLKPALRLRNLFIEFNFGEVAVKGRGAVGNILTKHLVDRVVRAKK